MESHGHSPLGSIKDRVDDVGFEHLSVLPHIQYNGTDEPITSPRYVATGYAERLSVSLGGPMCRKV